VRDGQLTKELQERAAKEVQERDSLASRIAAVLSERKKIGAERRTREHEYQIRNGERALGRYYKVRGESVGQQGGTIHEHRLCIEGRGKIEELSAKFRKGSDQRTNEINAAYEALKKP
jgi:hypothetical protein